MITRTLLAALFVGLFSGVFMTGIQQWHVVPLILAAEKFEVKEAALLGGSTLQTDKAAPLVSGLSVVDVAYAHEGHVVDSGPLGIGRLGGTLLANLVLGAGFALMLTAGSLLLNNPISISNGVMWGACAWLAIHMLPAMGLPPELPGFPAAEIGSRQLWWAAAVALSIAGIALLALKTGTAFQMAGLALIAIPHIFGAPQPADITTAVPALYAAEYSVAALASTLAFWLFLGVMLGSAFDRLNRQTA